MQFPVAKGSFSKVKVPRVTAPYIYDSLICMCPHHGFDDESNAGSRLPLEGGIKNYLGLILFQERLYHEIGYQNGKKSHYLQSTKHDSFIKPIWTFISRIISYNHHSSDL